MFWPHLMCAKLSKFRKSLEQNRCLKASAYYNEYTHLSPVESTPMEMHLIDYHHHDEQNWISEWMDIRVLQNWKLSSNLAIVSEFAEVHFDDVCFRNCRFPSYLCIFYLEKSEKIKFYREILRNAIWQMLTRHLTKCHMMSKKVLRFEAMCLILEIVLDWC